MYIISHLVLVKSSIAYCEISHSSLSVTGHLLTDSCQCSVHFVNLIASMLSPASLFVPIQICCTTKISSNINGEHGGVCILSLTREISGSPLVHQFFSHCTVGPNTHQVDSGVTSSGVYWPGISGQQLKSVKVIRIL